MVQSRSTLTKLGALLNVCLLAWDIDVFWIIMWRVNAKQRGKIRYCILVKIYIFSCDNMAFLCGISLLPEKKSAFLFNPAEAIVQKCSVQKVFLEISQNSHATLLEKKLWRRCFPVNFMKFLRTPFLTEHLQWLLMILNK